MIILKNRTSFGFAILCTFLMRLSIGSSVECQGAVWSLVGGLIKSRDLGDRLEGVGWVKVQLSRFTVV